MENNDFAELAARNEALSRLVLLLATQLEDSGLMNGHRFQESVLSGLPAGSPLLDRSAELMQELMANYSTARSHRLTQAMWLENRPGRNE